MRRRLSLGSTTITGEAPAATSSAVKRQLIVPAPNTTADSPGRGTARLVPLTTQASGSMRAATGGASVSAIGYTEDAGAFANRASAPSANEPRATTVVQFAGRPLRQAGQGPHFGFRSTTTRCPTPQSRTLR